MALRLLSVAKPDPASPPEGGNRLLLTEPAVPVGDVASETLGRICIIPMCGGSVSLTTSCRFSAHRKFAPVSAGFEEDGELVVLEDNWTP